MRDFTLFSFDQFLYDEINENESDYLRKGEKRYLCACHWSSGDTRQAIHQQRRIALYTLCL